MSAPLSLSTISSEIKLFLQASSALTKKCWGFAPFSLTMKAKRSSGSYIVLMYFTVGCCDNKSLIKTLGILHPDLFRTVWVPLKKIEGAGIPSLSALVCCRSVLHQNG